MDDLISDFVTEAGESLELIDVELVRFEANPQEKSALDRIFRLVHTLKGTCGFLGLERLERVAHAGETVLGQFRDGVQPVTPQAVTIVLSAIDRIKLIVGGLSGSGAEPAGDDAGLISELEQLCRTPPVRAPEPGGGATTEPPAVVASRPGEISLDDLEAAFAAAEAPAFADVLDEPSQTTACDPASAVAPCSPAYDAAEPGPAGQVRGGEDTGPAPAQSIRVDLGVLEGMMTLVSELVLTRNQLLQMNRSRGDDALAGPLQRLSTITGELQESVMKTRMQPIGQAWKKLPRLVRDLSRDLEKPIELVLEGESTELDRQLLEQIRDPLTHMVRNSADHGLEAPAERRAAGKPETGLIRLSAYHEGGSIVIRLRDDGRGLDTHRIREKAVERGLISRTDAEGMTDAQAHRLIFAPGFSTAAAVTNLSGRGVGMDVVRTNIEQIGGQIDLHSTLGEGCSTTIKIPLTLAIMAGLIVASGGESFVLPQAAVVELVRVNARSSHRFETLEQTKVLRLREELVPIIDLASELRRTPERAPEFVVVMQVGSHRLGVLVEDVIDTEEIVVKPLASVLRHLELFSGATILGDGSVVLIMDPNGLSARAGEIVAHTQDAGREAEAWAGAAEPTRAFLILEAGPGAPKAIDLALVTRLERIPAAEIEHVGSQAALQYRNSLLPVLLTDDAQGLRSAGVQDLMVISGPQYAMALAVDRIVDVVEARLELELSATRPGRLGTAVIGGRATEVIDVDHYAVQALAVLNRLNRPSEVSKAIERTAA